jgi:hypothetical protein
MNEISAKIHSTIWDKVYYPNMTVTSSLNDNNIYGLIYFFIDNIFDIYEVIYSEFKYIY